MQMQYDEFLEGKRPQNIPNLRCNVICKASVTEFFFSVSMDWQKNMESHVDTVLSEEEVKIKFEDKRQKH